MNRVHVFIDGGNLYRNISALRLNGKFTDFWSFFQSLVGSERELVGITYYVGRINPSIGKTKEEKRKSLDLFHRQQIFINSLKASGVKCRFGYFQQQEEGHIVEKGVDVKLAIDMIEYALHDRYDTAFLLSGDGDFTEVALSVRRHNKKVCNLIFKGGGYSYRLRNSCDSFFFIDFQVRLFVEGSS